MPGETIVIKMDERMIREIREDIDVRFTAVCEELELLRKVEDAARGVVWGLQTIETKQEQKLVDTLEQRLIEAAEFRAKEAKG